MDSMKKMDRTSRTHALIPAAGRGVRFDSGENKILKQLGGIPIVARTVMALGPLVDSVTVIGRESELPLLRAAIDSAYRETTVHYTVGGETRQESVARGIGTLADNSPDDIILVHDAARPLVNPDIIQRCIDSAQTYGSGVAAIPVVDTLKLADESGRVFGHAERTDLMGDANPAGFSAWYAGKSVREGANRQLHRHRRSVARAACEQRARSV